jgi:hypothetical protein
MAQTSGKKSTKARKPDTRTRGTREPGRTPAQGITNHLPQEEIAEQARLPDRGGRKGRAHA